MVRNQERPLLSLADAKDTALEIGDILALVLPEDLLKTFLIGVLLTSAKMLGPTRSYPRKDILFSSGQWKVHFHASCQPIVGMYCTHWSFE